MKSLKSKVVAGSRWSFLDNILKNGISVLVGIVLARLLSPLEYGLIGIITIIINVLNSMVDGGFGNALIRKKNVIPEDYNTVFFINITLSFLLAFLLFLSAPVISSFFRNEQLIGLARVMSFAIIINALTIVHKSVLTKQLDFKLQTKITFISVIVSGVIGITMAFCGYGVWSLVGQYMSLQITTAICFWIMNKWKPSFSFSHESFKDLFGFGSKLLLANLLDNVWKQVYQIVIGRCYNMTTLGLYSKAHNIASLPSVNISVVIQRVSFPALSTIQDNPDELKRAYKKFIKTTMYLTFSCMFMLCALAKPLVFVLLGDKWSDAVPYLQVCCLSLVLYPLHAINLNMLQVKGRSDLYLYLDIIKKILSIVPIVLGVFVGIFWMLWASVIFSLVSYFLNSFYSGRLIGYSVKQQINDIKSGFIITSLPSLCIYALTHIRVSNYIMLPVLLLLGMLFIVSLSRVFKISEYEELSKIIKISKK